MPVYGLMYGPATHLIMIINNENHEFLCIYSCGYTIKLLLTSSLVHMENIYSDGILHGSHFVWSICYDMRTNIFAYGLHSWLIERFQNENEDTGLLNFLRN